MRFDFLPRATLTLGYCETIDILDDTEVEFTCFGTLVAIKFYHLHTFTRRFDHAEDLEWSCLLAGQAPLICAELQRVPGES